MVLQFYVFIKIEYKLIKYNTAMKVLDHKSNYNYKETK